MTSRNNCIPMCHEYLAKVTRRSFPPKPEVERLARETISDPHSTLHFDYQPTPCSILLPSLTLPPCPTSAYVILLSQSPAALPPHPLYPTPLVSSHFLRSLPPPPLQQCSIHTLYSHWYSVCGVHRPTVCVRHCWMGNTHLHIPYAP